MTSSDQKFISYALNLAKKNLGLTAPNPVVGCVIVNNNIILATGVTAPNGRPHAEKIAIDKIANKEILKDCEIYVTLEPCFHFGQTNPCVDEIIKYKFKKVIISTTDPDKRVNGKSVKKLQEAGIEVVCGILEEEAKKINRGFFKARKTGLPFVTLKLATSLDGKIATKNFQSKWITNEKSRLFAHHLRAVNDAILVGANTIKQDNPSLDCRIVGLENFSPKKIIITKNSEFSGKEKIFQNGEVIILKPDNLLEALKTLCQSGINSVLVEGGKSIATQFLQQNLVDELVWIKSGKIIGDDGIAAIGELGLTGVPEGLKFVERLEFDGDVVEIFKLT